MSKRWTVRVTVLTFTSAAMLAVGALAEEPDESKGDSGDARKVGSSVRPLPAGGPIAGRYEVKTLNDKPLLVPPVSSQPADVQRFYRGDVGGVRFFFVPIDSAFRRARARREGDRAGGRTLGLPVTPDGPPGPREPIEEEFLRTYDELMLKGVRHFREREYQRAARQFRLGHVVFQSDVSSRLYLAVAYYAMRENHEALRVLREAHAIYPGLYRLPFDLRKEYVKAKEHQRHLDRLWRKVKASPPNAELKLLLATMLHFSGQPAEAEPLLTKAARRLKDDPMLMALHVAVRASLLAAAETQLPPDPADASARDRGN